jgi:hypothetical protein
MKSFLSLLSLCLLLASGSAFAAIADTTSPGDFQDTVDWCQFGCAGAQFATPQSWTSGAGATGQVGLDGTGQGFYNLQQGTSWNGNFPANMGLIYNGSQFENTPTGITVTFDSGAYGAGAYIQSNIWGAYTATVELFDSSFQPIGSYTAGGVATGGGGPPVALFIGMLDSNPDVYAAEFWAWGTGPVEPDFSIGTLGIRTEPYVPGVPEPVTFLLLGPALIGMGMLKRRLSH